MPKINWNHADQKRLQWSRLTCPYKTCTITSSLYYLSLHTTLTELLDAGTALIVTINGVSKDTGSTRIREFVQWAVDRGHATIVDV